MNIVVLQGNLARDPEVRVVNVNGKESTVATLVVAVHRHYKKANGDKDKETNFFPCEAWDSGAETIGRIFSKGDSILVNGSLKNDSWEKDGQKHSRTKIRIEQFQKLNYVPKVESSADMAPEAEQTNDVAAVNVKNAKELVGSSALTQF